jgi:hypothetical protein
LGRLLQRPYLCQQVGEDETQLLGIPRCELERALDRLQRKLGLFGVAPQVGQGIPGLGRLERLGGLAELLLRLLCLALGQEPLGE